MPFLNEVTLMGNVGVAPEIRYFADGTPSCRFRLVTQKSWKDANGQPQEKSVWHTVGFTGAMVTNYIEPYVKKGDCVMVKGEINNYSFVRQDNGQTQWVSEITGKSIQMIIKRNNGENNPNAPLPKEEPPTATDDNDDFPY